MWSGTKRTSMWDKQTGTKMGQKTRSKRSVLWDEPTQLENGRNNPCETTRDEKAPKFPKIAAGHCTRYD